MQLQEHDLETAVNFSGGGFFDELARAVGEKLPRGVIPIRFAVVHSAGDRIRCELGVLSERIGTRALNPESIFRFRRRCAERAEAFNAVLAVPTGMGCEIGGHAGDAAPVARLLGAACDRLILHPNVVNASDINEMPENALYVEGSVLSRLLMGTAGLQPVRSNRLLVVVDAHINRLFTNAAINSVSAARAALGIQCAGVVVLNPPVFMKSEYTGTGAAAGYVDGMIGLLDTLDQHRPDYDAVALASVIRVPRNYYREYYAAAGRMVNPWGGVEAMLTHAVSALYGVPSAHSPMIESNDATFFDPGIVDPRLSAEAVSFTYLHCILKGLHRAPRIAVSEEQMRAKGVLTAEDVSCLVIPDGCLGLPTLAALEQGIPVIAVKENKNLMQNDLSRLPWQSGQFHPVENYWEAAGVMTALRAGVAPESVRRPLAWTNVSMQDPMPAGIYPSSQREVRT